MDRNATSCKKRKFWNKNNKTFEKNNEKKINIVNFEKHFIN